MPVNTTHKEYDFYKPVWVKCNDATDGQRAIKEKTTDYLPMLRGMKSSAQPDELYYSYINYASWYGATGRTVNGLIGLLFRKEPDVQNADTEIIQAMLEDVDNGGKAIDTFAKEIAHEVVVKNRVGVLVDFPTVPEDVEFSQAEKERLNLRAYLTMYKAETIVNWQTTVIAGQIVTTLVVLEEQIEKEGNRDPFKIEFEKAYRVLGLDENGAYYQELWRKPRTGETPIPGTEYLPQGKVYPLMDGETMDYIPFYPITGKGVTWEIDFAIVNDLADMNISHYRNSASYENGLLLSGNPTPCVSGLITDTENQVIRLGSSRVLQFNEGGQWGYLEFSGDGLNTLKEALADKEKLMATLGARILAPDKKMVEAAETARIHQSGEHSVLANIADSISAALTEVVQLMLRWEGIEQNETSGVTFQLNKDYNVFTIDATLLTALNGVRMTGGISWDTWFYNLQKGELLPPDTDADTEKQAVEADKPEVDLDDIPIDEPPEDEDDEETDEG